MRGERKTHNARPQCLPETMLHYAWQLADATRSRVTDADGSTYRVLYSGMPGGSYGPDFRQAVLEREDGSEIIGDVEIHVQSREWYAHGHAEDAKYCAVKMHGVWSASDGDGHVVNAAGLPIPQIGLSSLHQQLADGALGAVHEDGATDGADSRVDGDANTVPSRMVCNAGDEWFAEKIRMYESEIDTFDGDLALQLGVFEALGYSRNRWQFRTLARRVPWHYIKLEMINNPGDESARREVAEGLLRWGAGFGDAPSFAIAPALAGDAPKWNRASGMPANRPEQRINGAAALVATWFADGGPMTHALESVRNASKCGDVWNAFAPPGSGIGQARAREIVVNVVLPFVAAWAKRGGDSALYAHATALFQSHPSMGSNSLLRESLNFLQARGFGQVAGRCARDQQGAIYLYKSSLLRPRPTRQSRLPSELAAKTMHR